TSALVLIAWVPSIPLPPRMLHGPAPSTMASPRHAVQHGGPGQPSPLVCRDIPTCVSHKARVSGVHTGAMPLGQPLRRAGACPGAQSVSASLVRLGQDHLEHVGGGAEQVPDPQLSPAS